MLYNSKNIFILLASMLMCASIAALDQLQTTLRELVLSGNTEKLERFLRDQPNPAALLNARDSQGRTALFVAPTVEVARLLVRYGAYLNDNNFQFGHPRADPILPLYHFPKPKELFTGGPQPNAVQIFGPTPSTRTKAFYTPSIYPPGTYVPSSLKPIPFTPSIYRPDDLAPGVYPSTVTLPAGTQAPALKTLTAEQKDTLRRQLVRLCKIEDAQAVEQFLLSIGIDHPEEIINARDEYGRTAIFYTKSQPVAKILIKFGADLEIADFEGKKPAMTEMLRPFYFPTISQNTAAFNKGFRPNEENLEEYTAKVIPPAAVPGALSSAQKHVRSQSFIGSQRQKIEALTTVIANGSAENDIKNDTVDRTVTDILKDHDFDVNRAYIVVPDLGKVRPIHIAVLYGDRALVQHVLNRGANINAVTERGQTPLDLVNQGYTYQQAEKLASIKEYLNMLDAGTGSPALAAPEDSFEWNWLGPQPA